VVILYFQGGGKVKLTTGLADTVRIRVELDDDGDVVVWADNCKLLWVLDNGKVMLAGDCGEQLEKMGFVVNDRGEVVIE